MKKITVIVFVTILLAACSEKLTPRKRQTPAEEVTEIKAKYTPVQVAQGKTIFENNCGKCHDLRQPDEFIVHDWNKILPKMVHKAHLDKADAHLVNAWIITHARMG